MEAVRAYCEAGEAEEGILTATQRPIVLLRKRPDAVFAPGLADALPELGVMLPYTPLQHLLLHDFAKASGCAERSSQREAEGSRAATAVPMLVMTSGNIHDEPIVIDDEDAYEKLFAVADAFLGHDRAIRARYDDSVVRVIEAGSAGEAVQFIRRARGYAPLPLAMPASRTPKPTTRGSRRRTATKRCSRSNPTASRATCIPSTSRRSGPTSRASPSPRCSTIMRTSCR